MDVRKLVKRRTRTTPERTTAETNTAFPLGDVKVMLMLMNDLTPCNECSSMPAIHLVIDPDKYEDGHDWDPVLLHDRGCPGLAAERARRAGLPVTAVHP